MKAKQAMVGLMVDGDVEEVWYVFMYRLST